MTFINHWQTRLNNSYTEFAKLANRAQDIDFTYGILATAILWPVSRPVKQFDLEAMQAVQEITGADKSGYVLGVVQNWPDDRLEAARSLAAQAQTKAGLRAALVALIEHFDAASAFIGYLAREMGETPPTGSINISDISGGEITVGNIITGIVSGDVVSGDKIAGDQVAGDKIVHYHIHPTPQPEPKPEVPVLPFEPETILIPAGPFLMGSDEAEADEAPRHEVDLPAYRIGKYPVTNREYAEFIKRTKYDPPENPKWFLRQPPDDKLDHPVTGLSWHDARAYCHWLSEQTGHTRIYRLPTEAEWEKAARGKDGRLYPWGNDWVEGHCNAGSNDTTPVFVGQDQGEVQPYYPHGASPYGCYDMMGNVQEWTSTLWGSDLRVDAYPYPYQADDGREDLEAKYLHRIYRVHRGGSFRDNQAKLRCSARGVSSDDSTIRWRGFRVVLEL